MKKVLFIGLICGACALNGMQSTPVTGPHDVARFMIGALDYALLSAPAAFTVTPFAIANFPQYFEIRVWRRETAPLAVLQMIDSSRDGSEYVGFFIFNHRAIGRLSQAEQQCLASWVYSGTINTLIACIRADYPQSVYARRGRI